MIAILTDPMSRTSVETNVLVDSDIALMLEVANDNVEAFEQLVQRYYASVFRMLDRDIGHEHVAEELAQEVFFRLYQARGRYRPTAKFSTWLFTITKNLSRNARRGFARRLEVQWDGESGWAEIWDSNAHAGIDVLAVKEQGQKLHEAIERLGDRQRQAIILSRFHGMSYEEVAAEMQLSPTVVKSLLARARRRLRQLLTPYFLRSHSRVVDKIT